MFEYLKAYLEFFTLTKSQSKAKQSKAKAAKTTGKKRAFPLTDEEINILYNRNVLGSHTPQSLLSTLMVK